MNWTFCCMPFDSSEVLRPNQSDASNRSSHLFDRVMASLEIYHNLYNHVVLFSRNQPDGLELLKLGIDTGNVDEWFVQDNVLYLRTLDRRDALNNRIGFWSLDLSNVLTNDQ